MAHITSIGAGLFSDMAVATPAVDLDNDALEGLDTAAEFAALFASEIESDGGVLAAGAFVRIKNVREFPAVGTPANIVNVPNYGSKTSYQIQGQADAPSMELTLNYIPQEWAKEAGNILGNMVGDSIARVWRFSLLNTEPTGTGATKYASLPAGLGTIPNSEFYFVGKLEAIVYNPQLTDANQATLTLSLQSPLFGAYTVAAV